MKRKLQQEEVNKRKRSFYSCLDDSKCKPSNVLARTLSTHELHDEGWLSSTLMNLILSILAKSHSTVYFMPVDFTVYDLSKAKRSDYDQTIDITGRKIDYDDPTRPIILTFNSNNIHWNLIRILRLPTPVLQLFEPMGKPMRRRAGLSFRSIPVNVIKWMDACCPLASRASWLSVSESAITSQHQFNSFDCGVACLLYAEKCARGQVHFHMITSSHHHHHFLFRLILR